MNTPRIDALANKLIPIAANITPSTAQEIITQLLTEVFTLSSQLERELAEALKDLIFWQSLAEGRGRTDDDDTGKAMAKLIRQRDEARAETIRWMSIAEGRGHTDETLSNQ